jgi:hypothetical protein
VRLQIGQGAALFPAAWRPGEEKQKVWTTENTEESGEHEEGEKSGGLTGAEGREERRTADQCGVPAATFAPAQVQQDASRPRPCRLRYFLLLSVFSVVQSRNLLISAALGFA